MRENLIIDSGRQQVVNEVMELKKLCKCNTIGHGFFEGGREGGREGREGGRGGREGGREEGGRDHTVPAGAD